MNLFPSSSLMLISIIKLNIFVSVKDEKYHFDIWCVFVIKVVHFFQVLYWPFVFLCLVNCFVYPLFPIMLNDTLI